MRSEKRGLFWWDWYSICSKHREYRETCRLCTTGQWKNRMRLRLGHVVYVICPWLWRKWANRKNNPDRKFLEETFPGLRKSTEERHV